MIRRSRFSWLAVTARKRRVVLFLRVLPSIRPSAPSATEQHARPQEGVDGNHERGGPFKPRTSLTEVGLVLPA